MPMANLYAKDCIYQRWQLRPSRLAGMNRKEWEKGGSGQRRLERAEKQKNTTTERAREVSEIKKAWQSGTKHCLANIGHS